MRVTFTVNGRPQEADDVWEGESLLYVLRERLGLPGSKNACEQGECGSCTVRLDGVPVCSCLVAAGQVQDRRGRHRRGPGRPGRRTVRRAAGVRGRRRRAVRLLHPRTAGRRRRVAGAQPRNPPTATSARRCRATCAAAPATRRSSTRSAWPPPAANRRCEHERSTPVRRPVPVPPTRARRPCPAPPPRPAAPPPASPRAGHQGRHRRVHAAPRRHPEGHRRVRVLLRPVARGHAVGLHPAQHRRPRRRSCPSTPREALATPASTPCSPTTTCPPRSSTTAWRSGTPRCSPTARSATTASRSRWSPPTTRRPPAGPPRRSGSSTRSCPSSPTRRPRPRPTRSWCTTDRDDHHAATSRTPTSCTASRSCAATRPRPPPGPTWWSAASYVFGMQDQAFLGPESGLAVPAEDGGVDLYVATQWLHSDLRQIAPVLGLPESKVRMTLSGVGGAFGGREDLSMQIHGCLLALRTGKPVKIVYNRFESFFGHVHRHPATLWYEHGATRDGRLTHVRCRIVLDGGAYASSSPAVVGNAASLSVGPYVVDDVDIEALALYTNNPPCGAMRGFGAVQACFAYEAQMDKLAAATRPGPGGVPAAQRDGAGHDHADGPAGRLARAGRRTAAPGQGDAACRPSGSGRPPRAPTCARCPAGCPTPPTARASCAASATRSASRTSASPRASTTTPPPGCGWRSSTASRSPPCTPRWPRSARAASPCTRRSPAPNSASPRSPSSPPTPGSARPAPPPPPGRRT